MRSAFQRLFPT